MITDFFQTLPIPADQFHGAYDIRLVILSFLVAASASYIALDFTGRLRDISNTSTSRKLWFIGGAIAMGAGIWSMHFIGMLSFTIPGLTLRYDLFWTGLSLVVAIVASGFALYLLQLSIIRIEHYIAGGIILGLAIAAMHYTGMTAMLITLDIHYLPFLFLCSIIVAIVASEAAIWLALKSNQVVLRLRQRIKLISAIIMGIAICGMHYTGMAASIFTPLCTTSTVVGKAALDPAYLSIGIAAVTFTILGIAFVASAYKESQSQLQFEKARQLGMAEISASVLHNVGNVLNSVNVSANTLSEKVSSSKMGGIEKLSALFNEHKFELVKFITEDSRGSKALDYLNLLSVYWHEEQNALASEINKLTKDIQLIKEIISTQQELSKATDFEQLILVNELIDEAVLITGLSVKTQIMIDKQYAKLKPVKLDKVKLLQILVNLVRNAKDSVITSPQESKVITIKTSHLSNNKIRIEITDNGVGIPAKNLKKIFTYGFTTKASGHGFGLHTSAIAAGQLGGQLHAYSEGVNQGATFVLEL